MSWPNGPRIALRLALGFVVPVSAVCLAGWILPAARWEIHYGNKWHDSMGEVVDCAPGRNPFIGHHARVVGYGLEDPRGIACDGDFVFIADGGRENLLEFDISSETMHETEGRATDPCTTCQQLDPRGLAMWDRDILTAEYQRSAVVRRVRAHPPGAPAPVSSGLGGPSGVARYRDELLVTDDRPWPAMPAAMPAFDAANYKQWIEQSTPQSFGVLYRIDMAAGGAPEPQDRLLSHPTGIAIDEARGLLYLAESDTSETRWLIFQRSSVGNQWQRHGVLSVATNSSGTRPIFQGIAVWNERIYAAGPDGVYVFGKDGTSEGKLAFSEPVAGLAVQPGENASLYLAAGHRLCRINLRR
jgi:hypothetical protein